MNIVDIKTDNLLEVEADMYIHISDASNPFLPTFLTEIMPEENIEQFNAYVSRGSKIFSGVYIDNFTMVNGNNITLSVIFAAKNYEFNMDVFLTDLLMLRDRMHKKTVAILSGPECFFIEDNIDSIISSLSILSVTDDFKLAFIEFTDNFDINEMNNESSIPSELALLFHTKSVLDEAKSTLMDCLSTLSSANDTVRNAREILSPSETDYDAEKTQEANIGKTIAFDIKDVSDNNSSVQSESDLSFSTTNSKSTQSEKIGINQFLESDDGFSSQSLDEFLNDDFIQTEDFILTLLVNGHIRSVSGISTLDNLRKRMITEFAGYKELFKNKIKRAERTPNGAILDCGVVFEWKIAQFV